MTPFDLIGFAVSLRRKQDFSQFVEYINNRVSEVYINIAKAHFQSAIQALESSVNSKSKEIELRDATSHLRDAYNIYDADINKTARGRFLIFFSIESAIYEPHQKAEIKLIQSHIARQIALLYKELTEIDNAKRWKNESLLKVDNYISMYKGKTFRETRGSRLNIKQFIPEDPHLKTLKDLNEAYITLIDVNAQFHPKGIITGYEHNYKLSELACNYLETKRTELDQSFGF